MLTLTSTSQAQSQTQQEAMSQMLLWHNNDGIARSLMHGDTFPSEIQKEVTAQSYEHQIH